MQEQILYDNKPVFKRDAATTSAMLWMAATDPEKSLAGTVSKVRHKFATSWFGLMFQPQVRHYVADLQVIDDYISLGARRGSLALSLQRLQAGESVGDIDAVRVHTLEQLIYGLSEKATAGNLTVSHQIIQIIDELHEKAVLYDTPVRVAPLGVAVESLATTLPFKTNLLSQMTLKAEEAATRGCAYGRCELARDQRLQYVDLLKSSSQK